MSFGSDQAVLLDRLDEAVRFAPQPTHGLVSKIIAGACSRIPVLSKAGKTSGIDRLVESGAWADAALMLIALELPDWTLRRLIREDGQWHCALSRHPNLPIDFDDTADATHEVMPLAILLAFLQARRRTALAAHSVPAVPFANPAPAGLICCENFA
ncbi:MAG: hypothetical protein WBE25_13340 [Xanthobacteraceae bacterium]|jgi:hypothetical protein